MNAERAQVTTQLSDVEPEKVVVFETIGPVQNFLNAIRRIEGLEWLVDVEMAFEPDEDFYDASRPQKALTGFLYLMMANARALDEVVSLWRRFQRTQGAAFDHGFTPWLRAFEHLRDVRYWDRRDRLRETGFGDYLKETLFGVEDTVRFEIDLWYRQSESLRTQTSHHVKDVLEAAGGRVLAETVHREIGYHALLAEVGTARVREWVEGQGDELFDQDEVMFFRPVGQSLAAPPPGDHEAARESSTPLTMGDAPPVVALLDGLPLTGHRLLARGLVVDDPDDIAANYPASSRSHGTAMASLILRGDLDAGEAPLNRQIYVRPVLAAHENPMGSLERTPHGTLIVDLMIRAVRRMFEAEDGEAPAAPSVRIINHSLGDLMRLFDSRLVSPWARVLDWLAWRYQVLFIVSAGNHGDDRALDELDDEVSAIHRTDPGAVQRAFIRDAHAHRMVRRLRVPGESINALTVGALHDDACERPALGRNVDPFVTRALPSAVNGIGLGYRGSVKPEILFPGGRVLYGDRHGGSRPPARVSRFSPRRGPGQRVAAPSERGRLDETVYTCGTSNATALATRAAARLYETLEAVRSGEDGDRLPDEFTAVLLKAMLVHGASWGEAEQLFDEALGDQWTDAHHLVKKRDKARLIGYGAADVGRVMAGAERRVTLLGCGVLRDSSAHGYRFPIPAALTGLRGLKRVVITLAWMTPINPRHQRYRRARLWAKVENEQHDSKRLWHLAPRGPDGRDAQRGTVQHLIYESERAAAIVDDKTLDIRVNCAAEAGELDESVPYGLVVTLEVADSIGVDVYAAVRQRLRTRAVVQPR